jgi:hypothetical protein
MNTTRRNFFLRAIVALLASKSIASSVVQSSARKKLKIDGARMSTPDLIPEKFDPSKYAGEYRWIHFKDLSS